MSESFNRLRPVYILLLCEPSVRTVQKEALIVLIKLPSFCTEKCILPGKERQISNHEQHLMAATKSGRPYRESHVHVVVVGDPPPHRLTPPPQG